MKDSTKIAQVLSPRATKALARNGIETIDQIVANYPKNLLRINGFGLASLRAVEAAFLPGKTYSPKPAKPRTLPKTRAISETRRSNLKGTQIPDFDDIECTALNAYLVNHIYRFDD